MARAMSGHLTSRCLRTPSCTIALTAPTLTHCSAGLALFASLHRKMAPSTTESRPAGLPRMWAPSSSRVRLLASSPLWLKPSAHTVFAHCITTGKLRARILVDDPLTPRCRFASPDRVLSVQRLLAPVDVPAYNASIRCLGTNYPLGGAKKTPVPILFL